MRFNDLSGKTFGMLHVISRAENSTGARKSVRWTCLCDCGNTTIVNAIDLTQGKTKSCGCFRRKVSAERESIDLTGQRFGRLVVINRAGKNNQGGLKWLCKCDCGNEKTVDAGNLKQGFIKSCGCIRAEMGKEKFTTHGLRRTDLYAVWCSMKQRCENPNNHAFKNYGGRGISVCQEWQESHNPFYKWSMSNGYKKGLTIDRINNDGNYEPSNCRWTTYKVQANNKRKPVKRRKE